MLCVSIACGTHDRMLLEMKRLAGEKIQLVELRLDLLRKDPDLGRLLKDRKSAVIVTVRRPQDGGFWKESEEKRMRLLRTAVIEGVDFVDLEFDIARSFPRYGKTRRIISYHNMQETPDLFALHEEMMKVDPDIIKIAVTPKGIKDVFRMLDFLKQVNKPGTKVPTVGISMSEYGSMTRLLAGKFGAPFTYASFSEKREIGPGMFYYKTMRDMYHYDSIRADTEIYGVVADPIRHSLSPLIHNTLFLQNKMNKVYLPFRVSPEDLVEFVHGAERLDLKGLSVTIPHKVAILQTLTNVGPAVKEIDACNTVSFDQGRRIGFNTDYLAAILSIESAIGVHRDRRSPFHGRRALVLGAGGAGKALAYGLKENGATVVITDGDDGRAMEVAQQLGCEWRTWSGREDEKMDMVVNCTPIGMYPNVDESPISRSGLRPGMVVFDAVYNPEFTWMIRMAQEQACTIIPGMEMFVGQAALQFKLFTGAKANVRELRVLVKDALSVVHEQTE